MSINIDTSSFKIPKLPSVSDVFQIDEYVATGSPILMFPPNMRGQSDHLPLIEFKVWQDENTSEAENTAVYLPIPSNISFNDSSSFNTINLEKIGSKVVQQVEEGDKNIKEAASSFSTSILDSIDAISAKFMPGGIGDYKALKANKIVNPNSNTTFEGNNIRNFSFTFKLVARSQPEAVQIRDIHNLFRKYSYAANVTEGSNFYLSYPCPWTIKFINSGGEENPYIPGIWSCYLTTIESTFNSTSNMYFNDDAPLEVDITLTFQETRVLNRTDILNIKKDDARGIVADESSGRFKAGTTTLSPPPDGGENIEVTGEGGN